MWQLPRFGLRIGRRIGSRGRCAIACPRSGSDVGCFASGRGFGSGHGDSSADPAGRKLCRRGWRKIDVLWRSDLARQISGFTLLGLLLLGLVFSLRKRTQWFSLGSYGFWRATHGVLGALVLLAMVIHTGLKLGENLNLVLAIVFLSTAMLGSVAGIASSIESKLEGTSAMFVRRWRPRMTTLHSLLFWPLPALIAVHIFSFYWYSD